MMAPEESAMGNEWQGVFPVVPTPLRDDESVDEAGLAGLVDYYLESGCHGAVVLGSGGEHPYFTLEERLAIVRAAVGAAKARAPVIVGMGFCGFVEARQFVERALALGADAFLAALPTYYPVAFADALAFYRALGQAAGPRIFYYHFPQVTRLRFSAAEVGAILALDSVIGIKESSLNLAEMRAHLSHAGRPGLALLTGTSYLLRETLALGGAGTICPIPSVAPKLVVECYRALKAGEAERGARLQRKILDLLPLMNSLTMPLAAQQWGLLAASRLPFSLPAGSAPRHAVIKETLRQLGHPITARVRRPLPQITDAESRAITALIERNHLAIGAAP
jgi:dihydrodipicolinate synthase/N-acetylneuraminate lyase